MANHSSVESEDQARRRIQSRLSALKGTLAASNSIDECIGDVLGALTECLAAWGAMAWDMSRFPPSVISSTRGVKPTMSQDYLESAIREGLRVALYSEGQGPLLLFRGVNVPRPILFNVVQRRVADPNVVKGYQLFLDRVAEDWEAKWSSSAS